VIFVFFSSSIFVDLQKVSKKKNYLRVSRIKCTFCCFLVLLFFSLLQLKSWLNMRN